MLFKKRAVRLLCFVFALLLLLHHNAVWFALAQSVRQTSPRAVRLPQSLRRNGSVKSNAIPPSSHPSPPPMSLNYTLTDLGAACIGDSSGAYSINASGQVVGSCADIWGMLPVLWDKNGASYLEDYNIPLFTYATSINAQGLIVGFHAGDDSATPSAFLWNDGYKYLPPLPNAGYSSGRVATSINSATVIAGYAASGPPNSYPLVPAHAVIWRPGSGGDNNGNNGNNGGNGDNSNRGDNSGDNANGSNSNGDNSNYGNIGDNSNSGDNSNGGDNSNYGNNGDNSNYGNIGDNSNGSNANGDNSNNGDNSGGNGDNSNGGNGSNNGGNGNGNNNNGGGGNNGSNNGGGGNNGSNGDNGGGGCCGCCDATGNTIQLCFCDYCQCACCPEIQLDANKTAASAAQVRGIPPAFSGPWTLNSVSADAGPPHTYRRRWHGHRLVKQRGHRRLVPSMSARRTPVETPPSNAPLLPGSSYNRLPGRRPSLRPPLRASAPAAKTGAGNGSNGYDEFTHGIAEGYSVLDIGPYCGPNINPASYAFGMNNSGKVVGSMSAIDANGNPTSVFYLYAAPFGPFGYDGGIDPLLNVQHAFVWSGGKLADLGTLSWMRDGRQAGESGAFGINDKGQVVGATSTGPYEDNYFDYVAFIDTNGFMQSLGTLWTDKDWPGYFIGSSYAYGINNSAQVVGMSLSSKENVAGGYMEDHAFVWQRDKMTDLNDVTENMDGWTLITANSINDRGQIVGTGSLNGFNRAFLLTPKEAPQILPANLDGSLASPDFLVSHPHPTIHLDDSSMLLTQASSDAPVEGALHLAGRVRSAMCDVTPGDKGQISTLQLYIDDQTTPIDIRLTVTKSDKYVNMRQPYPYQGDFDLSVPQHDLAPGWMAAGWHTYRLEAYDALDQEIGVSEFQIALTPAQEDAEPVSFVPSYAQTLVADTTEDSHPSVIGISGDPTALNDPAYRFDTFDGPRKVVHPNTDITGDWYFIGDEDGQHPQTVLIVLNPADSPDDGGDPTDPGDPGDPTGDPGSGPTANTATVKRIASLQGRRSLPGSMVGSVAPRGAASNSRFPQGRTPLRAIPNAVLPVGRRTAGTRRSGAAGRRSQDGGPQSMNSFGAVPGGPGKQAWDDAQFFVGFLKGFVKGGYKMIGGVKDVAKIIFKGTVKLVKNSTRVQVEYWRHPGERKKLHEENVESFMAKQRTVRAIGKLLLALSKRESGIVAAYASGDPAVVKGVDEKYRRMFRMGSDLLAKMWDQYWLTVTMNPEQGGEEFGYAVFQIASIVYPYAKAPELTKVEFFQKILESQKLKKLQLIKDEEVQAMILRTIAECKNTNMCFVAGTPVVTRHGLQSIERIRRHDKVLSRDPKTGRQAYKRVLQTIVTHPSRLYQVTYRTNALRRTGTRLAPAAFRRTKAVNSGALRVGRPRSSCVGASRADGGKRVGDSAGEDGTGEETLTCTGVHPFYVINRHAFVPAAQLHTGDRLRLASSVESQVYGLTHFDAQAGRTFTTYNLSVADFHTYFVGNQQVWVHNADGLLCQKFFADLKEYAENDWWRLQNSRVLKYADASPDEKWLALQAWLQKLFPIHTKYPDNADLQKIISWWKTVQENFIADTVGKGNLFKPTSIAYTKAPIPKPFSGCQYHHWWPQEYGGDLNLGLSFPLATPFYHTNAEFGLQQILRRYVQQETGASSLAEGKAMFLQKTFVQKKAILKEFYRIHHLDMPNFDNEQVMGTLLPGTPP